MQAIRTRYHGPTNTRGSRITASCEADKLTVPYDHALDIGENHRAAALALAEKLGWKRWIYVGGVHAHDWYWSPIV